MSATGKCLCGQVTYTLGQSLPDLDVCHCKNCQRQSGAAFVPFVAIPMAALQLSGSAKAFMDDDTESGKTVARYFCGECGSPLYVVVEAAPQTAYVAVGTLDNTHDIKPKCHGWTASKQDWVTIADGAPQHEFEPHLQPE
ncbi:MAG: GFA family protein [Halieaceae bacterium]|jgi:hypothetical protein